MSKSEKDKIDDERISFIQRCRGNGMWSPCVITNAYIRSGTRCVNTLQPIVITKSMFHSISGNTHGENGPIQGTLESNISGINACDLMLRRENSSSPIIKIISVSNTLTSDDISNIVRQKLIDIGTTVKNSNKQSLEEFGGFVYRPHKGIRDVSETLKILQKLEELEENEQYEVAEKELCNLPVDLCNEDIFENGPISGLEIG